ncbi:MAG: 50S ribosomal protein L10, partial [Thermoanaerobaculia bacterium]|nr:50S ribosomal protein L10 [Thermoanaerobaculia bacterium]
MLTKEQKKDAVNELSESVGQAANAFLIDYQGISVPQVTELRRQVRETNSQYLVVKNRLALIAIKDSPIGGLSDQFSGMTAVAYNSEDPVALAKALTKFAKDEPSVKFKGAMIEGEVVPVEQIDQIASLPSREELIAKLVFLLQSPIQGLANVLNANIRNLAVV